MNRQLARLESKVNPVYATIENPYSKPKPPLNAQPIRTNNPYNQPNPYSMGLNCPGPVPTMRIGAVLGVQNPLATVEQCANTNPLV